MKMKHNCSAIVVMKQKIDLVGSTVLECDNERMGVKEMVKEWMLTVSKRYQMEGHQSTSRCCKPGKHVGRKKMKREES